MGESDAGDSDDEDEPEAVRDFRRMMAFVAQRAGGGETGEFFFAVFSCPPRRRSPGRARVH